ncbi:hypothetical protein LB516_02575 [Mesorhizobium sp. CO1-1-7]|uniref:hypothetical protein n=1 Tax=Mesorhizobium sp. CO1-1-7 TaxID=2876632 RepID=UPI001CD18B59|nr:hypothetical protein [Mesorhizobium sp. CO1-1-7]MBZ9744128.1 hypothetical protein [Mesorhizobium sp. CO1-1-7]
MFTIAWLESLSIFWIEQDSISLSARHTARWKQREALYLSWQALELAIDVGRACLPAELKRILAAPDMDLPAVRQD